MHVLLIEDNPGDARLIREMLREARAEGVTLERVERLADGLARLAGGGIDAVLLDLSLPDSAGLATFAAAHAAAPRVPIVVLSGLGDETVAVRAVQAGAQDYLIKGEVEGHGLVRALRYAIERQRLAEERRALEAQKERFFQNVSHDLRTPLAAIRASIGVVLANEPPNMPEPLHRMLVNVDQAAVEMTRLINDLLELTRVQAGRVQLRLAAADARERVWRTARAIEPLARERSQRVEVGVPPEPVEIVADADRLDRALLNLATNAHLYGREGGLIELRLEAGLTEVVLSVRDDGPGIPEAEQTRIFERYYRPATGPSSRLPGSGLGLPIAQAVAELHGGRIWLESGAGAGTTFYIALPYTAPAAEGENSTPCES